MTTLPVPGETIPKRVRILIVEDERAVARDLKDSLEHLGYQVPAIAGSSDEAIASVEAHRPHLVLMDIVLDDSERDGVETAQEIRDRFGIPVVYLTAHATPSVVERVQETEPFGYLIKPFREPDLWVAIETALKRHSLEKVLHERESWLSRILTDMGDGVMVIDTETRVRFLNPVAETLTGWSQAQALNQPVHQVFQIIDQQTRSPLTPSLNQVLSSGQPLYLALDTLLISRNGMEVPIAQSAVPLRDLRGRITGGILVFRDICALLLANERNLAVERSRQLEAQMHELEELNRLKDDFLSTVSHELRTPLSNIKLAVQMLSLTLDQLGLLPPASAHSASPIVKYIDILQAETDRELLLINDLLDIQRVQADTYPVCSSLVQLQTWIPHIVESFSIRMEANHQSFQINIPPDIPPLQTDSHVLARIVSELLNNACKYTPPGEQIVVKVQGQPGTPQIAADWIRLEVCNSGVSIEPSEQNRIFDAFYRSTRSDRWAQSGTGLGLALAKKFTTLIGGQITVSSPPGWVCFRVILPVNQGQ
ncbi:MAG: ATP-binding protein [Synechococcales bacterium]|nr:ATP-binding protein [Synechococcales bacterium]